MPKSAGVAKQDPAAEEKFPSDEIKKGGPGQTNRVRLVILLHRRVASAQSIDDRRHEQNADCRNHKPGFPVPQGKTKFRRVFPEQQNDDDQWNYKIKDNSIPVLRWC